MKMIFTELRGKLIPGRRNHEKLRRETAPRTPRWSRDLLNQRKIQENLAKMKKSGRGEHASERIVKQNSLPHCKKRDDMHIMKNCLEYTIDSERPFFTICVL